MKSIKNIRKFLRSQTMTEYAIIVALIAIGCIVAVRYLGTETSNTFNKVGEVLQEANETATE